MQVRTVYCAHCRHVSVDVWRYEALRITVHRLHELRILLLHERLRLTAYLRIHASIRLHVHSASVLHNNRRFSTTKSKKEKLTHFVDALRLSLAILHR